MFRLAVPASSVVVGQHARITEYIKHEQIRSRRIKISTRSCEGRGHHLKS